MIGVSSTAKLEINMSKPRLVLVHCSNGIRPNAKRRDHGSSFKPWVIQGGAPARSVPGGESSREAALKLIELGFLVFQMNNLAFLEATIRVLDACNGIANQLD
jgi:hypothetical protein